MIKKLLLILIASFFSWQSQISAQCPTGYTANLVATPTAGSCPSTGTISATFNAVSGITVELKKGGQILNSVINPASPHTFTGLAAGTDYQVIIKCSEDDSVYATANVTVTENYTPISEANITTSNVCTNFTPGGTITINGVTGGSAPYTYSIVQSNNPTVPPGTFSTGNVFNVSAFGTYQIFVRDACNNIRVFQRTISPSLNPVRVYWRPRIICGDSQNVQGLGWYLMDVTTGSATNISQYPGGIKMVIRANNATGPILYDGVYTGAPFTYQMNPSHSYYVTTTNSCGATSSYMHNLTDATNNPEFNNIIASSTASGCGTQTQMTISGHTNNGSFWNYPITVQIRNSGGVLVQTIANVTEYNTWTSQLLVPGDYTVTYTSVNCPAQTASTVITNAVNVGPPQLNLLRYVKWRCSSGTGFDPLTQPNTTQVEVSLTGYVPDRPNAIVRIKSGPTNVGAVAYSIPGGNFGWTNMLNGSYIVEVITTCGDVFEFPLTVAANNSQILQQSLTTSAESFCSGVGNINSVKMYTGDYDSSVELLNSAGVVIAQSQTGNFTNLPAGIYTVRIKVTHCKGVYYVDTQQVEIFGGTAGPSISSAVGVICEDGNGVPIGTGSAYLTLGGVGPLTLRYRLSGTTAWSVVNNAPNNYQLNGLAANSTYELELQDGCGNTDTFSVLVRTMGNLRSSNTVHPCAGQEYVLAVPYYAGATYEWYNPAGILISSSRSYTFANFLPSDNGTYTAKIRWSNCVERTVVVEVNSNLCGEPIGEACFKNSEATGNGEPTLLGITAFGRAGAENSNWPMVRSGGFIALESSTKGFVITRTADSAIAEPVVGMMIYCTEHNCVEIYTESGWKCFTAPGCPD